MRVSLSPEILQAGGGEGVNTVEAICRPSTHVNRNRVPSRFKPISVLFVLAKATWATIKETSNVI